MDEWRDGWIEIVFCKACCKHKMLAKQIYSICISTPYFMFRYLQVEFLYYEPIMHNGVSYVMGIIKHSGLTKLEDFLNQITKQKCCNYCKNTHETDWCFMHVTILWRHYYWYVDSRRLISVSYSQRKRHHDQSGGWCLTVASSNRSRWPDSELSGWLWQWVEIEKQGQNSIQANICSLILTLL